jgi:tetratricopeptide (TPR) repeat protein
MAHDNRRRQDIILILAAEGARRDDLARALRKEGFKPTFIGVLDTVMDLLASLRPATLLHDWPTVEPTQAVTFHQRLGKSPSHVDMCRILYLPTLSPQAAALATDSGIRRLIPHSTSATAMASEIRMALSSLSNLPELQVRMLELSAGKKYDQALIDGEVEKAYKIFPHEPGVRLEFGLLCLRNRRVQIARVLAEDLVAENVQNVRAMNLLARTLMADGKADQASELLERANMLSPFNPERLVLLGDAFFSVGKNEKAAAYYTKAMAVDQHDHDAKAGLARVKLKDGDVNAALEIINSGLSEE